MIPHDVRMLDQIILLDDLENPVEAHHVSQVTTPRRVDSTAHLENVSFDLIQAATSEGFRKPGFSFRRK